MSNIKIPLERTGGRSLLADGVYRARIESVEQKQGAKGPYLSFVYNIVTPDGRPTDTKIWDNISLAEKARFKVDQFLDALEAGTEGSVGLGWFKGKSLWVTVTNETYQQQLKNRIGSYITPEMATQLLEKAEYEGTIVTGDQAFSSSYMGEEDEEASGPQADMPEDVAEEDIPF